MLTAYKKQLLAVTVALTLVIGLGIDNNVAAVEIAPIEKMDPDQLQDDLKDLGTTNKLTKSETPVSECLSQKPKPSIWSWLTNQSRKPESYHFIDIIEILK